MTDPIEDQSPSSFINRLQQFDARLARIEAHLGLTASDPEEATYRPSDPVPNGLPQNVAIEPLEEEDGLEFQIGQYVVAQVGIVVLVIGIAFLLTLPFAGAPSGLLPGLGYVLTAVMLGLVHFARHTFAYVARCLLGGGLFLLYFSTLRLHFFAAEPMVATRWIVVALLSLSVTAALIVAVRERSPGLACLGLTLGYVTAIVSEQTIFLLAAVLLLSVISASFSIRLKWEMLVLYAILLTYSTHGLLILNNPIMGGAVRLVTPSGLQLLVVLASWAAFAAAGLFRGSRNASMWDDEIELIQTLLNGLMGYGLYLLVSLAVYREPASLPHLVASGFLLALASVFWLRRHSRYATFIYAMLGYGALTLAIVFETSRPQVFIWLCWQSMLVLATALWFRSKFIVSGNFLIYAGVLLAYLAFDRQVGSVALHFGLVSLLSARILNWQKSRLELQTELMRNSYLAVAFLILPYALWRLVPREYVTLSWLGAGVVYYLLSIALRNKKYRWMALLTLMMTVVHVFVIGIARFEPVYRVISFVALGTSLLVVSLVYTGIRARRTAARGGEHADA